MLGPNGRCNLLCYSTQLIGNFVVLSLAMFLLAMNSCAISGAKGLHEKERLAKVNLRKGMSIDDAIATMEPFGFECKLLKNATLSYHAKPDDITPTLIGWLRRSWQLAGGDTTQSGGPPRSTQPAARS